MTYKRPRLRLNDKIDRLEAVKRGRAMEDTYSYIAGQIGITPKALSIWLSRNAPDGVDAALSDFKRRLGQ